MGSLRYRIRDVLWGMALLGLALGWWIDHERLQAREGRVREWLCYVMGTRDEQLEPLFEPPKPDQASRRRLQKDLLSPESLKHAP